MNASQRRNARIAAAHQAARDTTSRAASARHVEYGVTPGTGICLVCPRAQFSHEAAAETHAHVFGHSVLYITTGNEWSDKEYKQWKNGSDE